MASIGQYKIERASNTLMTRKMNTSMYGLNFRLTYFLIFIASASFAISQDKILVQRELSLKSKVKIGMSTDEVKKAIDRPNAVEGGFPDSDNLIIKSLPEQNGQLNNSTWFYFYKPIKISRIQKGAHHYFINNIPVDDYLYDHYLQKNIIYFHNGEIIDSLLIIHYQRLENSKFTTELKDTNNTYIKTDKDKKVTDTLIPILCVIFDRGTNVVAETRVFFKVIDTK